MLYDDKLYYNIKIIPVRWNVCILPGCRRGGRNSYVIYAANPSDDCKTRWINTFINATYNRGGLSFIYAFPFRMIFPIH